MEGYESYFENFTLQNKSNDLDNDLKKTINALYAIDSQRFQMNRRLNAVNGIAEQFSSNNFLSISTNYNKTKCTLPK